MRSLRSRMVRPAGTPKAGWGDPCRQRGDRKAASAVERAIRCRRQGKFS